MSRVMNMNRGVVALILVVAVLASFTGIWILNEQRAEAAAVPIPGTGCTLYADAKWSSTASPPVYTEGEVRCGSPSPTPTVTSILGGAGE